MRKYNLYWLSKWTNKPSLSSDNKDKIWKAIQKSWSPYVVKNKKGIIVKGFIPF